MASYKVGQVVKALGRHGFSVVAHRGRGSHRFLRHPDGRTTTIAGRVSDTVPRGTLAKILRDTVLVIEDL